MGVVRARVTFPYKVGHFFTGAGPLRGDLVKFGFRSRGLRGGATRLSRTGVPRVTCPSTPAPKARRRTGGATSRALGPSPDTPPGIPRHLFPGYPYTPPRVPVHLSGHAAALPPGVPGHPRGSTDGRRLRWLRALGEGEGGTVGPGGRVGYISRGVTDGGGWDIYLEGVPMEVGVRIYNSRVGDATPRSPTGEPGPRPGRPRPLLRTGESGPVGRRRPHLHPSPEPAQVRPGRQLATPRAPLAGPTPPPTPGQQARAGDPPRLGS